MLEYLIFLCDSIYCMFGYMYNPSFNHDQTTLGDVFLTFHSLFMTSAMIVLILYYPRLYNKLRPIWLFLIAGVVLAGLVFAFLCSDSSQLVEKMDPTVTLLTYVKYLP